MIYSDLLQVERSTTCKATSTERNRLHTFVAFWTAIKTDQRHQFRIESYAFGMIPSAAANVEMDVSILPPSNFSDLVLPITLYHLLSIILVVGSFAQAVNFVVALLVTICSLIYGKRGTVSGE